MRESGRQKAAFGKGHTQRDKAELGHVTAQFSLGWCHQFEVGIAKDLAQAVEWYRKAAEQGVNTAAELQKEDGQTPQR